MGLTSTVQAILLCCFIPQHKLGPVEIVQLDPGHVLVQQELAELYILMHNDSICVTMEICQCLGHVKTYPQFLSARDIVVYDQFLLLSVRFEFLVVRIVVVVNGCLFQVAMGEPFRHDANAAMSINVENARTCRQELGNVGIHARVFKVVVVNWPAGNGW